MTKDELLELADRCEREEPNPYLASAILVAFGHQTLLRGHQTLLRGPVLGWEWRPERKGIWQTMPRPDTSLDAAVSLVPEGMVAAAIHYVPQLDPKMTASGVARVYNDDWESGRCTGRTVALALCAAALRARAFLTEE